MLNAFGSLMMVRRSSTVRRAALMVSDMKLQTSCAGRDVVRLLAGERCPEHLHTKQIHLICTEWQATASPRSNHMLGP